MGKWNLLLVFVFIAFCAIFTNYYLTTETQLYVCDKVEYNLNYYDFGNLLLTDPKEFFVQMFNQVRTLNRNPFFVILLLPFYSIFKESRFGFIFATQVVFMLPVMLLLIKIIKSKVLTEKNICQDILIYSSILLFPSIWLPSMQGIPDICGLVPLLIAFLLYFKNNLDEKYSLKSVIFISVLLYLSFLFRRWYSVAIFSFFCSVFIENIVRALLSNEKFFQILKRVKYTLLNLSSIGALITVFGLLFQYFYVKDIIFNESAEREMYIVSYNQIPVIFFENIGLVVLIFSIIGIVAFCKNSVVRFISYNLVLFIFTYIVLMKNQFLWINHYSYCAVFFAFLFVLGMCIVLKLIKNNIANKIFVLILLLFNIFNFYTFFIAEKTPIEEKIFPLCSSHPFVDKSYSVVKDIYSYLEEEYQKDKTIKVQQYGLNNSMGYFQFRSIAPKSEFAKNAMQFEFGTDENNCIETLDAQIVIIPVPIFLFTDEKYSQYIIDTRNMILNGEGIGKNYKLEKIFKLNDDENTLVYIYKMVIPLTKTQIKERVEKFYEFYPQWKNEEKIKNLCL